MNITEGNIFEAMRLVLPEHRGVMKGWQRQRSARKPPVMTEDEIQDMQYTLSEAVENRIRVRLTLFGEHGDTFLEGMPIFDGRLRVTTDGSVQTVDVGKLTKVELL